MKLAVGGLIGYERALALYEENREMLEKRFPKFWLEKFLTLKNPANDVEKLYKNLYNLKMRQGGLFGALWKACEEHGTGCEVILGQIPIRQEIVEICELFDENPYEVSSEGAMLFVIPDDASCIEGLTIIGETTDKKERVIIMGFDEETHGIVKRFLTPLSRQQKDIANHKREK